MPKELKLFNLGIPPLGTMLAASSQNHWIISPNCQKKREAAFKFGTFVRCLVLGLAFPIGLCSYPPMAHNPPRVWMTDEQYRDVLRDVANRRQWVDIDDLADKMLARATQGKNVVLSPGTADWLARWVKWRLTNRTD